MKKKDFDGISFLDYSAPAITFDSLVIIPTRHKHDSGYMCMKYCAIKNGEPMAMLGGHSDVCHLDGIGGYGELFSDTNIKRKAWNFDCLPCGYIHMWCSGYNLKASRDLSDFCLYTVERV